MHHNLKRLNLYRNRLLTLATIAAIPCFGIANTAMAASIVPHGAGLVSLAPLAIIIVIFYFLLIRPQQKRMKTHRTMIEEIKRGDKIITAGGIIGTVHDVSEDIVKLDIADKVRVSIKRDTITGISD